VPLLHIYINFNHTSVNNAGNKRTHNMDSLTNKQTKTKQKKLDSKPETLPEKRRNECCDVPKIGN
jgi:hypothetical protein